MYPVQEEPIRAQSDREKTELLEAALAENRSRLREKAELFLRSGKLEIDNEFKEFWDVTLTAVEIEELLQILNNVRIGLWIKLGRPDPADERKFVGPPSEEALQAHMIMHVCAAWQGVAMAATDPESEA
jgi:hypothetical protein